jgi:hypothetical protein
MPKPQQTDQPCAGFVFLVDRWRACDTFRIRLINEVEEMNKQELIDKAVHSLDGVYEKSIRGGNNVENYLWSIGDDLYQRLNRSLGFSGDFVCTRDEFQQRASELGYINGYRWGVEYPTNGEEPDLPGDVVTTIKDHDDIWVTSCDEPVCHWHWSCASAFKITDQRYKPADTSYLSVSEIPESKCEAENVSDWYDYEAQKAVALPPVGEKVEVFLHWSESWSGWVVIVGHDHGGVIWRNGSDNKSYIYSPKDEIRPLDYNRKAEAEKKRVVDAAFASLSEFRSANQVLGELYDKGYLRTPSN